MYRVKFSMGRIRAYYYTEWFETLEEAEIFVEYAKITGAVVPMEIEDENEEII